MDLKDFDSRGYITLRERQEIIEIVNRIKTERGCVICGYKQHPEALDFHHPDNDKLYNIGDMVYTKRYKLTEILQEIEKCEVLCSNCHRVVSKKW